MHITPHMLEAAYELLRTTPPFRGWKLPAGESVEFFVTQHKDRAGDHSFFNGTHTIRISGAAHSHLPSVLITMAHEMCHMRQMIIAPNDKTHHGRNFRRAAAAVCRHHLYDPKVF